MRDDRKQRERNRNALRRMAERDPELAARLVLLTLPAAAARIPGSLRYDLAVEGLGNYRVAVEDGKATVATAGSDNGDSPDFAIDTDPVSYTHLTLPTTPYV